MRKTKIDIIKNAFLSSLSVIEEILVEIESIFEEKERIFIKIRRNLNKEKIFFKIEAIKKILRELKEELNIKEEEIADAIIVNSRCAKMWEILNDLKSVKLKRYGEIPEDIKLIIDPKIEKIINLIDEIVDLTKKNK